MQRHENAGTAPGFGMHARPQSSPVLCMETADLDGSVQQQSECEGDSDVNTCCIGGLRYLVTLPFCPSNPKPVPKCYAEFAVRSHRQGQTIRNVGAALLPPSWTKDPTPHPMAFPKIQHAPINIHNSVDKVLHNSHSIELSNNRLGQ
jgi:hypothetical protein